MFQTRPKVSERTVSYTELYADIKEAFDNFVNSEISIGEQICNESLQMWYEGSCHDSIGIAYSLNREIQYYVGLIQADNPYLKNVDIRDVKYLLVFIGGRIIDDYKYRLEYYVASGDHKTYYARNVLDETQAQAIYDKEVSKNPKLHIVIGEYTPYTQEQCYEFGVKKINRVIKSSV